jgi:hypothetical protein
MKEWNETEARDMLSRGISYTEVAKIFGLTTTTVHRRLDPMFAAYVRERTNLARAIKRGNDVAATFRYQPPSEQDLAARLAEIPRDTRSLTGRLCGDPLPGRSAFDRMFADTCGG